MYSIYIVQEGDTLESISNKTGISMVEISNLNNLDPFYIAMAGDKLIIPNLNNKIFDRYEIKNGDTLYNIAKKYNIDASTIAKINGIKEEEYIYPNTVLLVPKNGTNIYVTSEGDNLSYLSTKLNIPLGKIIYNNPNMILASDQIIIY